MERFRAKKSMGQNFLVDGNVLARIVEAVDLAAGDRVLEIGPGRGALTSLLVKRAEQVLAVELDRQLVPLLEKEFSSSDNVEFVQGDILRIELPVVLGSRWSGRWKVAANLPYNISSQVIFKFLDNVSLFSSLVLMLQKEVGDRLIASPGTKDYGILSVFCNLHFDVSRVLIVRPGSFRPIPKVDSVVLKFVPLPAPRQDVGDEALFRQVVKAGFGQRRKTLINCLKSAGIAGSSDINDILCRAGIDGGRRGETLSLEEYARLTKEIMHAQKQGMF
ncbi:16S rRNA (adenine(1518)-N(6)/adenine(1519)-N(6))-dimethyltransferase RsmA [Geotalea sp. SG265]|uniref:16S rRNA (adenine(1518)-N(6)/adenine(1519)-N(6))- dimethyltransferase RsmA n=1 Tax=Geotalea sp. SG265 TaxID=2922867 RepID=UPI001FAE792F|nr:16S rRNA (adenine(1518)-N(6)/adenine(1519)-N(6))-dimethyltransferase RsmA [Geotalea sp. SG265]